MNLLPKSHEEFSQTEYWNKFFKKRGKEAFEWYGEYPELCEHLHKYIKSKDEILMMGCGNSKLSADLYDVGFHQITNIDISQVVIRQMTDTNKNDRPLMKFIQMDATQTTFEDSKFTVILDKGTLDALMSDDKIETRENVTKYFREIDRVTRPMGRYICVSLLQEHILRILLDYFPKNNWMFRVVRCLDAERKAAETNSELMPVFILVATKFNKLPAYVLEVCLGGDKMTRVTEITDIIASVEQTQRAAMICNGLHKSSIADYNEVMLELFKPDETVPRFTVYIVDERPAAGNGKYAAFIVPQGREVEWLFSTKQGRQKLVSSAKFNRLAIVCMHRDQQYTSWDDVKLELSESVKTFAPQGLKEQIPYLSLGTDVGRRETIFRGTSEFSGDYIIEEITGDDKKILRRLIFLNNQFVIQSEALIKMVKGKNRIVPGYLACQHHLYMTVGVRMAMNNNSINKTNVLVVGLGGGGLCTFIQQCLRNVDITAIELDAQIKEVAVKYFGLTLGDNLNVVIQDGLVYLREKASQSKSPKYDAIIFDVDNKDSSLGLSCPPISFLQADVIESVKVNLTKTGIFILNLVCRDDTLKTQLISDLKKSFRTISVYQVEEEINEILYCHDGADLDPKMFTEMLKKAAIDVNDFARKNKLTKDELISVDDYFNELKI